MDLPRLVHGEVTYWMANGSMREVYKYVGWVDSKTDEPVDDKEVKGCYEKEVKGCYEKDFMLAFVLLISTTKPFSVLNLIMYVFQNLNSSMVMIPTEGSSTKK